jgi:outer membrane lipoprotein-sorting protein
MLLATLALSAATVAGQERSAAPPDGNELLRRADRQHNNFEDATFQYLMRIKEAGAVREVEFTVQQKGVQKRLVRFTSPDDAKGMALLIEAPDQVHALLPAFGNRIRRMGTQMLGQDFMGSDLTYEDLAVIQFAPYYTASIAGKEEKRVILELTRKKDALFVTPRLKLWIDQPEDTIFKVEYYDENGRKLRTRTRTNFRPSPQFDFVQDRTTFVNHARNDHETELLMVMFRLNKGLSDDLFTRRELYNNPKKTGDAPAK